MTDADILNTVKTGLGISGTYQDATLMVYIVEVKAYLDDAGVPADVIMSDASVGVITRGVADLWNYGNGNTSLSEYFLQRAKQLALVEDGD